jgi:hypothetical protein
VPYFPRPDHPRIKEGFAGGAAYSCHYPDREVLLCDADPVIAGIWQYLIDVNEAEILRLPDVVQNVDDLGNVPQEARWLVGFWLGRCLAAPRVSVGTWWHKHHAERPGDFWGPLARGRIASQLRYIRHWRVICGDYRALGDAPATWFVDPPFKGKAGRRYRMGSTAIDYVQLGGWCRERSGQVLVCEQVGAEWLPFRLSGTGLGCRGNRSTVLWTNDAHHPGQQQLL